ncbi:MAG: AI-2E family transporter [Ruminococcaceae bacterium]|nr:AI-2E family transporter [Oscillospiraceae bacterium]
MLNLDNSEHKKRMWVVALSCAVIFVSVYVLVNFKTVSSIFGGIISVFSPVIIGCFIAYLLNPLLHVFEFRVYDKIKRNGLRRGLSILCTYLVALAIMIGFVMLIIPQLIQSIMDLIEKFDSYLSATTDLINNIISNFTHNGNFSSYVDEEAIVSFIAGVFNFTGNVMSVVLNYVKEYGMGIFDGVKNVVLGLFISIYILAGKERLVAMFRKGCAALLGKSKTRTLRRYLKLTDRAVGGYFVGMILDAIFVGFLTLIGALIFRLPYAILISAIIACTNVIPIFGPFIGTIPCAFIIFIADPTKALIFVLMIIVIQQIDGNIVAPKILGNSTGLSSLGVIIAIIVMGEYFGLLGMILGVPFFSVIVIIIKEIVENRLKKQGLPYATEDYYTEDSLVDPYEKHENVAVRIGRSLVAVAKKIKSLFTKSKEEIEEDEHHDPES